MDNETLDNAIALLLAEQGRFVPSRHLGRASRLAEVLHHHPTARLVRCADEHTGRRFGRAVCRRGRAVKIGSTAWSPTFRGTPYQLWAVWEEDGASLPGASYVATPSSLCTPPVYVQVCLRKPGGLETSGWISLPCCHMARHDLFPGF